MPDTQRIFIAVKISDSAVLLARSFQDSLKTSGVKAKWVRAENMHITLKFLGNVKTDLLPSIGETLSAVCACHDAATLCLKGMGVFPGIRKARVVWAGFEGETDRLYHMQKHMEDELGRIGFPVDKRKFRFHLTLARIKHRVDSRQLLSGIEKFKDTRSDLFSVDRLILYESDLKPSGPIYRPLDEFVFGSSSG